MTSVNEMFRSVLKEIHNNSAGDVYRLKPFRTEAPIIFVGIDGSNEQRQVYIDLGLKPWEGEQLRSLPKWRGIDIHMERLERVGPLCQHYFLVLRQEAEQSADVFEAVIQNLCDHLDGREDVESLFAVIYRVLERWRNFFMRGGYRRLSDEQLRGLFGELWFIQEWMQRFPGEPPLLIEQWEGPTSGRIDFVSSACGIEIKTAVERLGKHIKISNERQLSLTDAVNQLYLYVCFIELSKTHGISLQDLVRRVRELINPISPRLLLKFNDLLMDIGFQEEEYADIFFNVNKVEVYEVIDSFPKIEQGHLPVGIAHVSYSIDLTHCRNFERPIDNLFQLF